MTTRAIVNFTKEGEPSDVVATVYIQCDGYPTGVGADIKKVLGSAVMRNGYRGDGVEVNGPGCAAAQFVAAIKKGVGNVYVVKTGQSGIGEDYTYFVDGKKDEPLWLRVDSGKRIYDGPLAQFDPEAVEENDNEAE